MIDYVAEALRAVAEKLTDNDRQSADICLATLVRWGGYATSGEAAAVVVSRIAAEWRLLYPTGVATPTKEP